MANKIDSLIKNWKKKNIAAFYCDSKKEALSMLLEIIPSSASVGFSGSVTLEQLGILKILEERKNKVINHNKPGLTRQESLAIRREAAQADYYLASANAVSENGELVFLSAYGNRTAGVSYARNAIVICGINKITKNLEEALRRAKEYAMPLNCQRLNWDNSRIMICQVLLIEAEVMPDRLKVIMVGESLGF